jgi:hypothetical protein
MLAAVEQGLPQPPLMVVFEKSLPFINGRKELSFDFGQKKLFMNNIGGEEGEFDAYLPE